MRIFSMQEGCGLLMALNIQCLKSLPLDVIPPEGFLLSVFQSAGCLTGAPMEMIVPLAMTPSVRYQFARGRTVPA